MYQIKPKWIASRIYDYRTRDLKKEWRSAITPLAKLRMRLGIPASQFHSGNDLAAAGFAVSTFDFAPLVLAGVVVFLLIRDFFSIAIWVSIFYLTALRTPQSKPMANSDPICECI